MIIQRLGHQPTVTDLARLASAKISDVHQLANIEQSELEAAFLTVYQFPTSTSLSSSRLFIVLSEAVGQFFEDPVAELGELRPYVDESG